MKYGLAKKEKQISSAFNEIDSLARLRVCRSVKQTCFLCNSELVTRSSGFSPDVVDGHTRAFEELVATRKISCGNLLNIYEKLLR